MKKKTKRRKHEIESIFKFWKNLQNPLKKKEEKNQKTETKSKKYVKVRE